MKKEKPGCIENVGKLGCALMGLGLIVFALLAVITAVFGAVAATSP